MERKALPMTKMDYEKFLEGTGRDDQGRTIEEILGWDEDPVRLELTHDYIQRVFPLPDPSRADRSVRPAAEEELARIRGNETAKRNVARAYDMMLRFWELDGEKYKDMSIRRHWVKRHGKNHNLLRISRVLKCLKLLDMSEYDDFAMRVRYLLSLSEKGQFPLRSETKAIWNRILSG